MKATLILFALCVAFLTVNCLPAAEETTESKSPSTWFHPVAYKNMMCRMECRQNCMEQGYWYGNCKGDECFCYGYSGPNFLRMKEAPVPMF